MNDLSVVIPVYKEEPKYIKFVYETLKSAGCEVLIVNDGNTVDLDFPHISYTPNMGYGYALKQGIKKATRPIVLTMDGDGQHRIEDVAKLYTVFSLISNCAMVVGCRWNLKEKPHRFLGRKIINFFASLIAKHYLIDLNSGMRIFRRDLAIGYSPILCDTFSFTTSLTMAMVTDGYKIAWFPIDVKHRNSGKSHVRPLKHGLITLYYIFYVGFALRTRWLRMKLRSITGR